MGLHLLFVCRYACGWLKIILFAPIPRKRKPKPSSEYPIFRNHTYSQKIEFLNAFFVHFPYIFFIYILMAQKPNWPGFLADARPLTAFRLSPDKVVSGVSQRDSLARKGKVEICKIGIRMLHHLSQRHQTSNSKKTRQFTTKKWILRPVSKPHIYLSIIGH